MGGWTLEDIDWKAFQKNKVDTSLVKIVRAASMVEYRSGDYVLYLKKIFSDDKKFINLIEKWGYEEKLHGKALAKWLSLADPNFNFNKSYDEFYKNYSIDILSGIEAIYKEKIMLRLGQNSVYELTGGIGIDWNDFIIDYAFLPSTINGIFANHHLISLSVSVDWLFSRFKKYKN